MKKKIIFAVATGFFAVATMFNLNMLQSNKAGDVSLDAISVMAQAQSESGGGKGTLYGNAAGTRFCCAAGSNSCSAAPC